jgi:hypothetical protein
MEYLERLERATYTSPSGAEFEFIYTALSRSIDHRIGSFEFNGVNGTLHQDNGSGGEVYPLTVIFNGADVDIIADGFLEATKEIGKGILNHPRWGERVVQVISCTQSENLVSKIGEITFEVEFQETLDREFADPTGDTQSTVDQFAVGFFFGQSFTYAENVRVDTIEQARSLKDVMRFAVEKVNTALAVIASGDNEIASLFGADYLNIVTNLDEYVASPYRFAESIIRMISIPATLVGRIDSKLTAYKSLMDSVQGFTNVDDNSREIKNAIQTDELIGTGALVAISQAISRTVGNTSTVQRDEKGRALITVPLATYGFQTRGESLASALYMRDNLIGLTSYLDTGQSSFLNKTLYEMYVQVINSYYLVSGVVNLAMRGALSLSFKLPAKRSLVLLNDSTFINECYRHYGGVTDETLDFFIQTNNLNNHEMKILPKGKEIFYYA